MDHKKISHILKLAGWLAVTGIVFVFYLATPMQFGLIAAQGSISRTAVIGKALAGLPYLLALRIYFAICTRIGENRSFCRENAVGMERIAELLGIAGIIWAAALILHLTGLAAPELEKKLMISMDILAMLASFAVSMVAKMMEHLLSRAAGLQEDSDLTI